MTLHPVESPPTLVKLTFTAPPEVAWDLYAFLRDTIESEPGAEFGSALIDPTGHLGVDK